MFKKAIVAGCALAACTSIAVAGHSYKDEARFKDVAPCPMYQFMAGPYLGLSAGSRVNYASNPAVFHGLEGTASIGYAGMLSPMFYLAGEIIGANSIQLQNYPDAAGNSARTTWTYGLDIIPGMMVTDNIMGYFRGGVVRSRFNHQNRWATGWQAGLGLQGNIVQNWDLRSEYVFTWYNSVTGIGKPWGNQFNIGVVYKFM